MGDWFRNYRRKNTASIISKTSAVVIGGGVAADTRLSHIYVSSALVGTCIIAGFADSDGTAQDYTLPIGFSGVVDFGDAVNLAGALTVTVGTGADDNKVIVFWSVN